VIHHPLKRALINNRGRRIIRILVPEPTYQLCRRIVLHRGSYAVQNLSAVRSFIKITAIILMRTSKLTSWSGIRGTENYSQKRHLSPLQSRHRRVSFPNTLLRNRCLSIIPQTFLVTVSQRTGACSFMTIVVAFLVLVNVNQLRTLSLARTTRAQGR